jgi:hypothetical protein
VLTSWTELFNATWVRQQQWGKTRTAHVDTAALKEALSILAVCKSKQQCGSAVWLADCGEHWPRLHEEKSVLIYDSRADKKAHVWTGLLHELKVDADVFWISGHGAKYKHHGCDTCCKTVNRGSIAATDSSSSSSSSSNSSSSSSNSSSSMQTDTFTVSSCCLDAITIRLLGES